MFQLFSVDAPVDLDRFILGHRSAYFFGAPADDLFVVEHSFTVRKEPSIIKYRHSTNKKSCSCWT